jgi:hypothetical protein
MMTRRVAVLSLLILGGCAQAQSGPGSLLILPPLTANGYANTGAPLSKWQVFGNYSGLTDCNTAIASNQMRVNAQVGQISQAAVPSEDLAVKMKSAECVAADDPRLTAN